MVKETLNLTSEQVDEINNIKKQYSSTASVVKKCDIALLLAKGCRAVDISHKIGCSVTYVYKVKDTVSHLGIGWLWSTKKKLNKSLYSAYKKDPINSKTELSDDIRSQLFDLFTDVEQSMSVRKRAYVILRVCSGCSTAIVAHYTGYNLGYVNDLCKRFANEGMKCVLPRERRDFY